MAYQAPAPGQKENPGASTESVRSVTAVRRRAGSAKPKAHGCPSRQLPHQPQGQTCQGVLCSLPPPVADDNEGYGDGQCQPQGHSCCPPWNDGGMPWGERKGEGDIFDAGQSLETFLNTVSITDHSTRGRDLAGKPQPWFFPRRGSWPHFGVSVTASMVSLAQAGR